MREALRSFVPRRRRECGARRLAPLAAALAVLLAGAFACDEAGPARPNVLLVTLDTTRSDRLGAYGYERATSPNFDALAREATLYENAYATSSWTLPSHASLFTGKVPSAHGVRHDPEGGLVLAEALAGAPEDIRARGLDPAERTLAKELRGAGYSTAAVVGGPWLLRPFGFASGFQNYDDRDIDTNAGRRAESVTDGAIEWLQDVEAPFFLFLNYFDPHAPYWPPPSHRRAFVPDDVRLDPRSAAQAGALYDGEILYMDRHLGRLLRFLRETGQYEETLVVVTSDHGELLGEHDSFGHERWLWEELVRVPLAVKPARPDPEARRVATRVQIIDLFPMILERVGLEPPEGIRGRAEPDPERVYLAEVEPLSPRRPTGSWKALWEGPFKFLRSSLGERYLFDLRTDPTESRNLADRMPERAQRAERTLQALLASRPRPSGPGPEGPVDEGTREALRALGYLEGEPEGASQRSSKRPR